METNLNLKFSLSRGVGNGYSHYHSHTMYIDDGIKFARDSARHIMENRVSRSRRTPGHLPTQILRRHPGLLAPPLACPTLAYQGMSGIALATQVATWLRIEHNVCPSMLFVRKIGTSSHSGLPVEFVQSPDHPFSRDMLDDVWFVDDLISSGKTLCRVSHAVTLWARHRKVTEDVKMRAITVCQTYSVKACDELIKKFCNEQDYSIDI